MPARPHALARWASLEKDAMSDESNPDLGIRVGVDQMHYEVLEAVLHAAMYFYACPHDTYSLC